MDKCAVLNLLCSEGVERGFNIVIDPGFSYHSILCLQAPKDLLMKHYEDLADKPFYKGLVEYMASGPVFAMVSPILPVILFLISFVEYIFKTKKKLTNKQA